MTGYRTFRILYRLQPSFVGPFDVVGLIGNAYAIIYLLCKSYTRDRKKKI